MLAQPECRGCVVKDAVGVFEQGRNGGGNRGQCLRLAAPPPWVQRGAPRQCRDESSGRMPDDVAGVKVRVGAVFVLRNEKTAVRAHTKQR